ncbi:MAG: hypothetical protein K6E38_00040 [Fretibacterium sp.]|nr:hypothetical protein [Fretibacterium sp.]
MNQHPADLRVLSLCRKCSPLLPVSMISPFAGGAACVCFIMSGTNSKHLLQAVLAGIKEN